MRLAGTWHARELRSRFAVVAEGRAQSNCLANWHGRDYCARLARRAEQILIPDGFTTALWSLHFVPDSGQSLALPELPRLRATFELSLEYREPDQQGKPWIAAVRLRSAFARSNEGMHWETLGALVHGLRWLPQGLSLQAPVIHTLNEATRGALSFVISPEEDRFW